jgi:hypothetical protein
MGSCVLRATGDNFNPTDFLQNTSIAPCNIFQKGERKSKSSYWNTSGITVDISLENDFSRQIADAIVFLKTFGAEINRLKECPGLERMSLDFGVNNKSAFVQSYAFPIELIGLAFNFAIELEISIYS